MGPGRAAQESVSAPLSAELTQDAAVVGLDPLFGEAAIAVVAEDVDQVENDRVPGRGEGPTGLGELAHEPADDRGLAGDIVPLHDHDAAGDGEVIEGSSQRPGVALQALAVPLVGGRRDRGT